MLRLDAEFNITYTLGQGPCTSVHEADEITRLLYPAIYIIPHFSPFVKNFLFTHEQRYSLFINSLLSWNRRLANFPVVWAYCAVGWIQTNRMGATHSASQWVTLIFNFDARLLSIYSMVYFCLLLHVGRLMGYTTRAARLLYPLLYYILPLHITALTGRHQGLFPWVVLWPPYY